MAKHYVELESGSIIETDNLSIWPEAKRLSKAEGKRRLKAEALKDLRKTLRPGDTVYSVLRHVSASGMSRRIDFYVMKKNRPVFLSGQIGRVLDLSRGKNDGLVVGGCGMDMGFHVVHNLGYALWPKGTKKPHGTRNGEPDSDGGYALNHKWM